MGIISWIVLGAIAGWVAYLIAGGGGGVLATIVLGIVGALVGGFLSQALFSTGDVTGVNIQSIVIAVIGSIIVLAAYRALMGRRAAV